MHSGSWLINKRLAFIALLGFASGLPLSLTSTSLQAWFTVDGVDIVTIGFLGLLGLPYTFKFFWAPLLDRFQLPWLGRRRDWILFSQIILIALLIGMAFFDPLTSPGLLGGLAMCVALASATQDIAYDAYRTELLPEQERGIGSAYCVAGYRLAMVLSGGVAFILADHLGWPTTYLIMAACMALGLIGAKFGPDIKAPEDTPQTLRDAVVKPLSEFLNRTNAWALLLLILVYKLGDAFAGALTTTFLLRGLSFSLTDVGMVTKVMGILATLVGAFIGGISMARLGLFRALLIFGLLQAFSNLLLLLLAVAGKHYSLMVAVIFVENLCGGMGTAAFMALLMSLCHPAYTAAQFALLSALASVGRVIVGPFAGVMVAYMGWVNFYFWTFVVALPGIVLLIWLRGSVEEQTHFWQAVSEQSS